MDNKWTFRDVFFACVGVVQVVLLIVVLMMMVQADRQYERLNQVIDLLESDREAPRAPVASNPSTGPGTPASQATRPKRDEGDWLVRNMTEPQNLNPVTASDAYESIVNSYVFESLLERDNQTLKFIPSLAERWEIADDKLHFRFYIDKRARWADGEPVTADDVVFTYQVIMHPEVNCPHLKVYYKDIRECKRIDSHTVEFTYAKPYWRALTFCGGMSILPKHYYAFGKGDEFNKRTRQTLASGPYRLHTWDKGKQIVLERNERYWRAEKRPAIKRIVFRLFGNETAAFQAMQAGDLDYMGLTPELWTKQAVGETFTKRFRKLKWVGSGYNYIGWNQRRPFFKDRLVRQAMTRLVPRELIQKKVYEGLARIVTGPFNYKTESYDHAIKPYAYDPAEAAKLLDKAGWTDHDGDGVRDKNGVKFSFELKLPSGRATYRQVGTLVKQECERVGLEVKLTVLEWAVFLDQINDRKFDAVALGWSVPLEADPYQIWHSSQRKGQGHNFIGFSNAEVDRICIASREEFDESKRNAMFHRFHQIMHEEQPYTFLMCSDVLLAADRRFHNVVLYPNGVDPQEWFVPRKLQRYR